MNPDQLVALLLLLADLRIQISNLATENERLRGQQAETPPKP